MISYTSKQGNKKSDTEIETKRDKELGREIETTVFKRNRKTKQYKNKMATEKQIGTL